MGGMPFVGGDLARRLPVLFLIVALFGCAVTSTSPVASLEDSDPMQDYLLGS